MANGDDGVRNARIISTFLGYEDHGFFIFSLTMDYGGGSQQGYQRILGNRLLVNSDAAARIADLLLMLDADSWEMLRGRYCRCEVRNGLIARIGHPLLDKWTREGGELLSHAVVSDEHDPDRPAAREGGE